MGAKRAKRRYDSRNNIINFQTHTHKQVQILPRNRNQETYILKASRMAPTGPEKPQP